MYVPGVRRAALAVIGMAMAASLMYWLAHRETPALDPNQASLRGGPSDTSSSEHQRAGEAPSSERVPERGWLAGRVTSGGAPVAGATLSLVRVGLAEGNAPVVTPLEFTTEADGRFRFEAEPGRVRVLAEATGYAVGESREVWLKPGTEIASLVIELGRDGQVTVLVRTEDDQPIKGATVETFGLSTWQLAPLATDAKGEARLERVPPGELRFRVRAVGFSSAESPPVVLEPGGRTELTVVLGPLLGINGRVLNGRGDPVAGAQVSLQGGATPGSALSEKDGSFRFEAIEEGLYALRARHPRYGPSAEQTAASGDAEVELRLTQGGELEGRVERADGTPARHFFVVVDRFVPTGEEALKGRPFKPLEVRSEDGVFLFSDLAPGTYDLVADSPNEGGPATAPHLEIAAGVRSSGLVMRLGPGGTLEGRVVEATGAPVPDVGVRISDALRSSRQLPPQVTRTDAEGRFRYTGLGPGRRSVHTRKKGYVGKVTAGVNINAGEITTVEITLPKLAEGEKPKTEFYGIGAVLEQQKDGALLIQKLMEGAPSAQFGLQKGDRILAVDGEDTGRLGMERAVELIRGEEGTSVELEVLRPGDAYPFRVRIDRGRVSYEDR